MAAEFPTSGIAAANIFISMNRKRFFLLQALLIAVVSFGTELASVTSDGSFVSTDGASLVRGGKPYRFVGTNLWYGPILASKGQGGDRQRLKRELDSLKALGVTNLRVLVGSDGKRGEKTKVEPTLQIAPGVYNDTILDGLDYFMAELQRRDMQAVLYLNNTWEWSGGYKFYLDAVRTKGQPAFPLSSDVSWQDYCKTYSAFSTNEKAQELFYDYVRFIVSRTNRYTGRPYSEDPALFSWQIGNEPRAFSKEAKAGFEKWIAKTAALIRSLDGNHLISVGSEGIVGCEGDPALFERISADPNIDVLNFHLWPSNWGWSSKEIAPGDLERAIFKSLDYINRHVEIARRLKKPLALEEFGFPRDGGNKALTAGVTARNRYYSFIFSQLQKAVEEGSPLVGVNFWGWAGTARPKHEAWQPGDDYTCDPAHEPQGLYSVFDSDKSTVKVIRESARRLAATETCAVPWRAIMIDVSRHFMPINYLYKEIDAMAHFGLNRLHLHLTDAAGWRIEIKSRPRLTGVGAWRTAPTWEKWWNGDRGYSDSIKGHGGFYTQDQMRDLVVYAAERGVDIMPEIEFPAHSEEVVAAYPEVGFNHAELDMSKSATYKLMRDVLEEVAAVFPSTFLHVGGDEAATQHNLQPEGMRRVKQIVDSLGRRMVVWDEALTDEPRDSDMVIMVWRDAATADKAAALGHDVVLCPGKYCYLDKAQDAPLTQPRAAGGYLPTDSVYSLPNPLAGKPYGNHLLGVQANLWTEHIDNPPYAEYMLWPRAYAIAELGRHGLTRERDFKAFHARAVKAADYLRDKLSINAFELSKEVGERKQPQASANVIKIHRDAKTGEQFPQITYNTPAHRAYPGSGDNCLIDGVTGGWNNNDGRWQGFIGNGGMDVVIDLGAKKKLTSIMGDFVQSCGPGIFFPYTVEIEVSTDGKIYKPLYTGEYADIYAAKIEDHSQLGWSGKTKARYIRFKANLGPERGWVFCSEVIVTEKK